MSQLVVIGYDDQFKAEEVRLQAFGKCRRTTSSTLRMPW